MAVRENLTANRSTTALQDAERLAVDTATENDIARIILANLRIQQQKVRIIPRDQL